MLPIGPVYASGHRDFYSGALLDGGICDRFVTSHWLQVCRADHKRLPVWAALQ